MCGEIFAAAMCSCFLLEMLVFVKNSRICVKSPKNCKNRPALPVKFAKNGGFLRFCGWFLVCLPFPAPKLAYFLSKVYVKKRFVIKL